ncbi:MAG: hypothetical protein D6824_03125 [Planctomycetota bacterium]|nr:MAG: hypothetical protein D6824_03125 [Planctomycetota bacterium]
MSLMLQWKTVCVLTCCASFVAAPGTAAQPLADEIVQAPQLDAQARATLTQYVRQRVTMLESGQTEAVEQARRELIEPFRRQGVRASVAFRLGVSDALAGALERLAQHESDFVAANALLVAGPLATGDGLTALQRGFDDPRPSVRYAAAAGAAALVEALARGDDALPEAQAAQAVSMLGQALAAEPDPVVVDGVVLAMTRVVGAEDAALQFSMLTRMCQAMAGQVQRRRQALDEHAALFERALVRAVSSVRRPFLRLAGSIDRDFALQAAAMSGQALRFALARWESGAVDSSQTQQRLDAYAKAAETVLIIAHGELTRREERALLPAEGALSLEQLRRAVSHWTGPNGVLTGPPYNMDPAEFQ